MGECPECGANIWETVRESVDPIRDRLPAIHNPISVGGGLVWISICMFFAALVLLIVNWFFILEVKISQISFIRWWQSLPLSGVISLLMVPGIWMLWPARASLANTAVLRSIGILIIGVIGWGVLGMYQWFQIDDLAQYRGMERADVPDQYMWLWISTKLGMLLFALIFLWGLNGILSEVGRRSRKYRSARGGRQRLREIGIAIAIAGIGMVLAVVMDSQALHLIGVVVTIIANLVILIGLAFLIVNTLWIFQDLRPRPSLEQLFQPRSEAEPEAAVAEDPTEDPPDSGQ